MRVLTENEVRGLALRIEAGGRLAVPAGAILTPLARDYLRARNIQIQEGAGAAPAQSDAQVSENEALVDAVAAEVAHALQAELPESAQRSARDTGSRQKGGPGGRAVVWAIGRD